MNYKVYEGTELKQTVTSKMAVMNGLKPNTTYEFSVQPDYQQTDADGKTRYMHVAYANTTYVATENDRFTLSERSIVRFGAGNNWVYKTFDAGTYTASNDTFGRDPCPNVVKRAEVVSDFSVEQSANKTYVGTYTDLTQTDSTNPSDYTWSPIRDGDATRDGTKETISVTTRGIRFNIPKTLTVGSTITLRYEEYPLGTVTIGNEPSGMFGGGNKQNLSAKVISTANGSSVVEVAGNVIDVGNKNLLIGTGMVSGDVAGGSGIIDKGAFNGCDAVKTNTAWEERYINLKSALGRTNAKAGDWYTISVYVKADKQIDTSSLDVYRAIGNDNGLNLYTIFMQAKPITTQWQQYSWSFQIDDNSLKKTNTRVEYNQDTGDNWIYWAGWRLDKGDVATPYAAFVDGDTFTAQPDGTYALLSEYKALYY